MGNILFGRRACDHPTDESAISLSDSCVEKLIKPPEEREDVICKPSDERIEDDKWMRKLRCIDRTHSEENGITLENMEQLFDTVEKKIGEKLEQADCPTDELIECLKTHKTCIIKCSTYMNNFIDCVDTARIEAIKKSFLKEEENECHKIPSEKTCQISLDEEEEEEEN
ncbi:uncharacterized protein [Diabrotica undecimpunctata]|uniref:uncharacterized protein n=1 Tax=Diabrotica undecimpunctata TaxID=50387 RepID=UPI003B638942